MSQSSAEALPLFDEDQLPVSAKPERKVALVSRDEMNLAEFPLTVLSTRVDSKVKTLEFSDSIRGKNGELVARKWIITGADKFGLPTSSDDEVLLGLLKLTVDDGFRSRKIYFTRYELLRILRWTTEGRSYSRLQNALDRLSGVRIKASNAFFDNELKSHSTRNFGILDGYEINDGRDTQPKPSFFTWSEVLYKSFQTGFIKKLDLDFFLDLKSAVTKRLYRYLDKHFWYRASVTVNLFTLAHEKIGISRNYRYVSSIRQQLDPALEELGSRGFISRYEYEGRGSATTLTVFAAAGKPRAKLKGEGTTSSGGPEPIRSVPVTDGTGLVGALEKRGIRAAQAERLLRDRSPADLERIGRIIRHFDHLVATSSRLVSRSPIGFLYRAVERPERFVLPDDGRTDAAVKAKATPRTPAAQPATRPENPEAEYLIWRRREIDRLRGGVEPELLQRVQRDVEGALVKLRDLISESRFAETVRHGVDEKLAALMAVPDFAEWKRRK